MNPEEIRKCVGQNILHLRKEYGLSRKALAKLIYIPEGRLRRVENGDPGAKLYDFHLKRIADVFDVSIELLYQARFL